MRKISAHYIFPVTSKPLKNGILVLNDNEEIVDIIDTNGNLAEQSKTEFYNGVIVPGFINTHCHLELSYLKNKIPQHTGHPEFISQIVEKINTLPVDIESIYRADREMKDEGIVAVGDISNSINSAEIKRKSSVYYHTFIELADFFSDENKIKEIDYAKSIADNFENYSLVGHAPYTTSPEFIEETAKLSRGVYSIHNQEAPDEDLMYLKGEGDIFELMKRRKLINEFTPTFKTALRSYLDKITNKDLVINLIHNIYSPDEDIIYAESLSENIYWTLCPNSNLYIQNKLPDYKKFLKNNCKITLGTDSLATNTMLSIIEEMKNFTSVKFEEVLKWSTINGAKALKIDNQFGSFEKGKKPGVNLVTNFNYDKMHLTEKSRIQKL